MMFLLNDTVLTLESIQPPLDPVRFRALSVDFVLKLGAEAFAERPLLQRTDPVQSGARADPRGLVVHRRHGRPSQPPGEERPDHRRRRQPGLAADGRLTPRHHLSLRQKPPNIGG